MTYRKHTGEGTQGTQPSSGIPLGLRVDTEPGPAPEAEPQRGRRRRAEPERLEPGTTGAWLGGYWRANTRGERVFYIDRHILGHHYHTSTRKTDPTQAEAELRRFLENPARYRPMEGSGADAFLRLDDKLIEGFLAWCEDNPRNEGPNSPDWIRQQRLYLKWWQERFGGRSIKALDTEKDLRAAVRDLGPGARRKRIAVIKAFFVWLRTERELISGRDDPTRDLKSEQARRREGDPAIPMEHIAAVWHELSPHYRDAIDVFCATGWHVTELVRFAQSGWIGPIPGRAKLQTLAQAKAREEARRKGEPLPEELPDDVPNPLDHGEPVAVLWTKQKSGDPQPTRVSASVRDAAARLIDPCRVGAHGRRGFSIAWFHRAILQACRDLKIDPPFGPGRFRHTVATFAVNAGQPIEAVSAFLRHKSGATTKRFYARFGVPGHVTTPN